jgi:purine nucleosidase
VRYRVASLFACVLAIVALTKPLSAQSAPAPTPVIFDTDMWGDIDDVLALAMLHTLQDRGEAKILAITSSTADKWCASYIDLLDTFYGHSDIPVGLVRNGVHGHPEWIAAAPGQPNYTEAMSELRRPDGSLVFPHALIDGALAPDSVKLLRKTLAAQLDGSVVIIQVGFSTNLARLLDSRPDDASPLSGAELVARKVKLLSVMGGQYGDVDIGDRRASGMPEFNLMYDVPSAQRLFAAWPTPIVASGFEIGASMFFKGSAIDRNFGYVDRHPVAETYRYTDPIYRTPSTKVGMLHDHATFDLTSVLYAVRPDDGYFTVSVPGQISVLSNGSSRFKPRNGGTQRYLIMNDEQRARALEAMTLLASEPPVEISSRGTPAH